MLIAIKNLGNAKRVFHDENNRPVAIGIGDEREFNVSERVAGILERGAGRSSYEYRTVKAASERSASDVKRGRVRLQKNAPTVPETPKPVDVLAKINSKEGLPYAEMLKLARQALPETALPMPRPTEKSIIRALEEAANPEKFAKTDKQKLTEVEKDEDEDGDKGDDAETGDEEEAEDADEDEEGEDEKPAKSKKKTDKKKGPKVEEE